MRLWQWCVHFPQSPERTFGLLLNKGELSGVMPGADEACEKWETRVWKMETGEVAGYSGVTLLPSSSSLPVI